MIFRFADPWFLLLLAAVPFMVLRRLKKGRAAAAVIRFSSLASVRRADLRSADKPFLMLFSLRMLAVILLILALARPQSGVHEEEVTARGIDIVLSVDVSTSMLAEDLKPNRLEAVKTVAADFIRGRKNDRIGLVIFAAQGFTQCPLTMDYGILYSILEELETGVIEDGTAIGMGLVTSINRLRSSEAKSKVIIALTDGRNNRGQIDPVTAAQAAQALGIKIYTIGAGSRGTAMYPVTDQFFGKRYVPMKVDIDEGTLQKIADMTGGRYFRAVDKNSLEAVWNEIDAMETTEIKVSQYTRYSELFFWFTALAGLLLLLEIVLGHTRYRKIP